MTQPEIDYEELGQERPEIDFDALERLAKESVSRAAFWSAFADSVKVIAEAARTEAVQVCGSQRRESTTAEVGGKKLGKLSRSPDSWAWAPADGAQILAYFERTYPQWIEVVPEHTVTVPEERRLDTAKVKQWLAGLNDEGVDTETGRDCTDMIRKSVTDGRWTLTKDKAAKERVLAVLRIMADSGVPIPADMRKMIDGGR